MAKKEPNFALIRPQKADFVQILLLFRARYCLYDQAGSFPSTFIESEPSQDTLGKYIFQQKPLGTQGKANRVQDVFGSNFHFEFYSKNLQIGFSQKALAKKV